MALSAPYIHQSAKTLKKFKWCLLAPLEISPDHFLVSNEIYYRVIQWLSLQDAGKHHMTVAVNPHLDPKLCLSSLTVYICSLPRAVIDSGQKLEHYILMEVSQYEVDHWELYKVSHYVGWFADKVGPFRNLSSPELLTISMIKECLGFWFIWEYYYWHIHHQCLFLDDNNLNYPDIIHVQSLCDW